MLGYEGKEDEMGRVEWDHGGLITPPEQMCHQHFNTGGTPSRYLAVQFGTVRYPMISAKLDKWTSGNDTSIKEGGNQIEYEDHPGQLRTICVDGVDQSGVRSEMGEVFDEEKIRAENWTKYTRRAQVRAWAFGPRLRLAAGSPKRRSACFRSNDHRPVAWCSCPS